MNKTETLKSNLINNVVSLCLEYSDSTEDYIEKNLSLDDFDTLLKWEFQKVYNYQAIGSFLYNHKFYHKQLFDKKALLVHSCPSIRGNSLEKKLDSKAYENFYHDIWLLEDMTFAHTFSHVITYNLNDEKSIIKYTMVSDLFVGEFDVDAFINAINMLCDEIFLDKFNKEIF